MSARSGRISLASTAGEGLAQSLDDSAGSWALGNVEVQDSSWSVIDREPHVEQPESHGWGDEEIHAIGSR